MRVRVKFFPVRYNGRTYRKNDEIIIEKEHFDDKLMEIIAEDDEEGVPKPPSKLTKDEIKEELQKLNIEFDPNAKKEELLELLLNPPTE